MGRENSFLNNIKTVFLLDLRALALLRIALSLVLMADIIFRLSDLKSFYTGMGVLPVEILFKYHWNPSYFSFFTTNDNYYLQAVLFLVTMSCVFCLMIGYRTKLFTVIVWLLLVSIHNRNPMIIQAGDHLLRMIVFWAIFLPWGYLLSVDSFNNERTKKNYRFESFASLAYICQIAFIYYFSALIKSSAEWRSEFTAIYYALSIDQIIRPLGEVLYSHYDLLKVLTAGVFYMELILPLLLFIPFYNAWFRMAVIIIVVLLQLGIFFTMNVGLFSATAIVIMIGLLPGPFLNQLWARFSPYFERLKTLSSYLILRFPILTDKRSFAPPKPNVTSEIIVAIALVYVLGWNLQTVGKKVIPDNFLWIGNLFKLEQHWGMFAPSVFKDDGWFIYVGTTKDERKIDLLRNGKPVQYEKPTRVADLVKNDRWRKYGENIIMKDNMHFRPYFCNFLIEDWNTSNPDRFVTHLNIIYMHEKTLPHYQRERINVWNICTCTINADS